MQVYDSVSAVDLPALEDGQLYLYVLENAPQGEYQDWTYKEYYAEAAVAVRE